MNTGNTASPLSPFVDVNTDRFNERVATIEDVADLTTCADNLNQILDQYTTLFTLANLYNSKQNTKVAIKAVEALVPSNEVTVFTIGKAIIKGLFNICRWVLQAIGKVWKFFFKFFKRSNKDTKRDIDAFYDKIPYVQHELVSPAVSVTEVSLWSKIIEAHCSAAGIEPNIKPGTQITAYKEQYYTAFNSHVASAARVNTVGAVAAKPRRASGAVKVSSLGWVDGDKLRSGLADLDDSENRIASALKGLRDLGGDIAKVANLCNDYIKSDSSQVDNRFIHEKGSECINAACFTTIITKDSINLKRLEDSFGAMVSNLRNRAKKYSA